jgi:hypothetical protein
MIPGIKQGELVYYTDQENKFFLFQLDEIVDGWVYAISGTCFSSTFTTFWKPDKRYKFPERTCSDMPAELKSYKEYMELKVV